MPHTYTFLDHLKLDSDVVTRVSRNLDGIVSGSDVVLRTPLAKGLNERHILTSWLKVLSDNSNKINEKLEKLESLNTSKFGARSVSVPWDERKQSVLDYFSPENIENAIDFDSSAFLGTGRLRPISYEKAIYYLKNSTNSGMPYYRKKGDVKSNYISHDYRTGDDFPCVPFTRTQESKKTRTVWGYPMKDIIQEMRFYRPLLDFQKKTNWRSAICAPSQTDKKLTSMVDKAMNNNELQLLSIDFSAYDSSVKNTLQKWSFMYIKSCFQASYHQEIDEIAMRFNTIGLITPDCILEGSHGVPSGSTFTNEVDSIAQYLIASKVVNSENFDIQGDDGAYVCTEDEVGRLLRAFKQFGLLVNSEKSYIESDNLVYLQNIYSSDYRNKDGLVGGIYPTTRALCRLLYLEKFDKFKDDSINGKDYFSIRAISILENCKHHPLFREFVNYVKGLDKYSLNFSDEGLFNYVKRLNESSGVAGVLKNQYGSDLSGIRSFETYKLLVS